MVNKKTNKKNSKKPVSKKSSTKKATVKKKTSVKASKKRVVKDKSTLTLLRPVIIFFLAIFILSFVLWAALLDYKVREKFEGKRWSVPAKVYSRPLELFVGLQIHPSDLLAELKRLQYKESRLQNLQDTGSFTMKIINPNSANFTIKTRGFYFSDGEQASQLIRLEIVDKYIVASSHAIGRLEPQLIGGIYPSHNEDRVIDKIRANT